MSLPGKQELLDESSRLAYLAGQTLAEVITGAVVAAANGSPLSPSLTRQQVMNEINPVVCLQDGDVIRVLAHYLMVLLNNTSSGSGVVTGTGSPEGVVSNARWYWQTDTEQLYLQPAPPANTGWRLVS